MKTMKVHHHFHQRKRETFKLTPQAGSQIEPKERRKISRNGELAFPVLSAYVKLKHANIKLMKENGTS